MRDLLERIVARYPRVAQRCYNAAAIWLAAEAIRLEEGQSLRRSEDDILPGLAQAVRESGIDLAEMACECGIDLIDLRRTLALSRLGELMNPGEVWRLCDQDLESKIEQAAREYSLDTEELLDEASRSSAVTPGTGAVFPQKSQVDKIPSRLRCRVCRQLRPQPYRIDFTPHVFGAVRLLRDPAYACHRCLPMYLADQQVQQVTQLTESEIQKPNLRAWSAGFAAVAILVLSGVYVRGTGAARESARVPVLPATVARAPFADERAPRNKAQPAPGDTSQPDFPATASASMAAQSQASGIDSGKRREIAAFPVLTPGALRRTEKKHMSGGQRGEPASDRTTAVNHCRQILHSEKQLIRYSMRDAVRDADTEAVSAADACATTARNLAQRGNECADLFNWFKAFHTKLTNHVSRVCRAAVLKGTAPNSNSTAAGPKD